VNHLPLQAGHLGLKSPPALRCKNKFAVLAKGFPSTQSRGFGMMGMMLEMMAHTGAYETAV
jgi:hypothetical protein